jgi:hypothetical protein
VPAHEVPVTGFGTKERLAEIAEILAAGVMRLQARKSSRKSADFGESSVDLAGHRSGHADPGSLEIEA